MVGSTSPESLRKHQKIVIITQQNLVSHGEGSLLARISTQKLIRVALEWPWGGLPDVTGAMVWGPTPNQSILELPKTDKNRKHNQNMSVSLWLAPRPWTPLPGGSNRLRTLLWEWVTTGLLLATQKHTFFVFSWPSLFLPTVGPFQH